MKKSVSVLAVSLLLIVSVNAQEGVSKKMAEEAQELKELPLLVVLRDTDKHEERVEFNENLKKAMEMAWTFSKIDRYISIDQWRELSKDKNEKDKYAILHYTERTLQANAPASCLAVGMLNKKVLTHFSYLPFDGVADMIVALKTLQHDLKKGKISMSDRKNNYIEIAQFLDDSLSHKILLLDKNNVSESLSSQISTVYPFPYKLASKEEIDEAIIKKDDRYLYYRRAYVLERPLTTDRTDNINNVRTIKTKVSGFAYNCLYNASNNELIIGVVNRDSEDIDAIDLEVIPNLKNYN